MYGMTKILAQDFPGAEGCGERTRSACELFTDAGIREIMKGVLGV
jgi:hypothetical protein